MAAHLWAAAHDHLLPALVATANLLVGVVGLVVPLAGVEVNDGVLATAVLFVVATGTGIAGWALVMLIRLSNIVSRLETVTEDHERRLASGGI